MSRGHTSHHGGVGSSGVKGSAPYGIRDWYGEWGESGGPGPICPSSQRDWLTTNKRVVGRICRQERLHGEPLSCLLLLLDGCVLICIWDIVKVRQLGMLSV